MTNTTTETADRTTLQTQAENAGRRFRGRGKDRALRFWDSQQNTIGYPYMDSATEARARAAFLRGAGYAGRGEK